MARIEEQYNISVKPNLVRVGSTISSMDFEVYIDIAPNSDNYQFNPDAFSAIFNVDETHIAYDDGNDDPITISITEQSLVKVNDAYTRVILRSNNVNIGPINKPAKIYMRAVCSGSYEIESDDGYVTRQNVEFGSTYIRVTNSASDQTWTLKEDSIKTRVGDNAYNFIEGDTHGECTIQIADTSIVSHVYISGKELTINPSGGGRTNITVTTAGVPGVWNSRSQQFSVQVDKLTNWTVSPREMTINGNVSSMQTLNIVGGSITPAAKVGIYDVDFNFYESTVSKFGYIKNISLNKATRTITFSLDLNKTSTLTEQTTDRFWAIDDSTSMYSSVYQEIAITINPFEKGDQTWPASLSDSYNKDAKDSLSTIISGVIGTLTVSSTDTNVATISVSSMSGNRYELLMSFVGYGTCYFDLAATGSTLYNPASKRIAVTVNRISPNWNVSTTDVKISSKNPTAVTVNMTGTWPTNPTFTPITSLQYCSWYWPGGDSFRIQAKNPITVGSEILTVSTAATSVYSAKSMNIKVEILPELSFKSFDVKINTAQGIQTAQAYVVIKDPRGNLVWRKVTPHIATTND